MVLQPVLGADKRNAVFTVYRAQNGPAPCLHVYYGAELLEVVPEDRRHPAFKLLLGRLYNSGIKAVRLQQSFGVDRKTLQRWGGALRCADPQQLVRALAGRGGPRKLTPEIRAFVTLRFPQLYGQSRAGYSRRVRAEIEGVFGVKLSGECLRPCLRQLKAELRREMGPPARSEGRSEGVAFGRGQTRMFAVAVPVRAPLLSAGDEPVRRSMSASGSFCCIAERSTNVPLSVRIVSGWDDFQGRHLEIGHLEICNLKMGRPRRVRRETNGQIFDDRLADFTISHAVIVRSEGVSPFGRGSVRKGVKPECLRSRSPCGPRSGRRVMSPFDGPSARWGQRAPPV